MRLRIGLAFVTLTVGLICVFVAALVFGRVAITPAQVMAALAGNAAVDPGVATIVRAVRLPTACTAGLAGASLAVAGLQMQTLFRNPLADPFSLGVSSGASLGVALTVAGVGVFAGTAFAATLTTLAAAGTVIAAACGAAAVLALVIVLAGFTRTPAVLLIIGVMVGSAVTAAVSLLLSWTRPEQAQQFIMWGLGSFTGTIGDELWVLAACSIAGIAVACAASKPMDALLLGEDYARSHGVSVRRVRLVLMGSASLLTGAVTSFCGPIGFLGIAVPHAARRLLGTSRHHVLVPTTALMGASAAIACQLAALAGPVALPINVVTSLVGAPVVVLIVLRSRSLAGVS